MPTYENPRTGVVHWVAGKPPWGVSFDPRSHPSTVCFCSYQFRPSWDWNNFDAAGVPTDVTCRKCRETTTFLDTHKKPRRRREVKGECERRREKDVGRSQGRVL